MNEKEIIEKYPLFFRDSNKSMQETCLYFGLECDSGWYDLLNDAFAKIEVEIEKIIKEEPNIPEEALPKATQVKEKFGTLRLYVNTFNDAIAAIIREAEAKSAITCELCGQPGELCTTGGWLKTMCNTCMLELNKKHHSVYKTVKDFKKEKEEK